MRFILQQQAQKLKQGEKRLTYGNIIVYMAFKANSLNTYKLKQPNKLLKDSNSKFEAIFLKMKMPFWTSFV